MNDTATSPSRPTGTQGRHLYAFSVATLVVACFYFGLTAKVRDPLHLYEGIIIMVLAALPSVLWAKSGGNRLPLFEVLMLTSLNTYALPLLSGSGLFAFTIEEVSFAGAAVILFQSAAMLMYFLVRGLPGRSPFFTEEVISHDINRYVGYGLVLTTIYTFLSTYYDVFPQDLLGIMRAVFYGVGLVAVFVQTRRWGTGDLPHPEKVLLIVNLVIQVIIQFSTLFLVGGISIVVLGLVGYVSGSRRLPVVATLCMLGVVALLHNGKSDMREKYWDLDGNRRQATVTELPSFYAEWLQYSVAPPEAGQSEKAATNKLLERTSLFHILCLVTSRTPDPLPFIDGETYAQIPGQLVPRFFWPEKPLGHVSTSTLSIHYGLQRSEDTAKTTIGFGTVSEAYANYGMFGIGLLGCFYGLLYRKVETLCSKSPLLSYAGLLQIVLMAWSFQTEFPMSLWLSSMFQAWVAVMGLPFLMRNLFG